MILDLDLGCCTCITINELADPPITSIPDQCGNHFFSKKEKMSSIRILFLIFTLSKCQHAQYQKEGKSEFTSCYSCKIPTRYTDRIRGIGRSLYHMRDPRSHCTWNNKDLVVLNSSKGRRN